MSNSFAFTCEQLDVAQWLSEYNSYMFPQADGTLQGVNTRIMSHITAARSFTASNGFTVNDRICLPVDYSAAKRYPLHMHLHGGRSGRFRAVHPAVISPVFCARCCGQHRPSRNAFFFCIFLKMPLDICREMDIIIQVSR